VPFLIHINYQMERNGIPIPARFKDWAQTALRCARRRVGELSIVLVDEVEGRAINLQYRGRDDATNVLSFPIELGHHVRSALLGDLIICVPVIAREADEQNKKPADHYAHMVVHGTLHLLGYDHIEDAEAKAMETLETRILAKFGIADPYSEREA